MESFNFNINPKNLEVQKVTKSNNRKSKQHPTLKNLIKGRVVYNGNGMFKVVHLNDSPIQTITQVGNIKELYENATEIYTTPENDKYTPWSIKHRNPGLPSHFEIVYKFWSALKPDLIVYGIMDIEGYFKIIKIKNKNIWDATNKNTKKN